MRRKDSVFASNGALDPSLTDSNFVKGMIAGTIAKAEDVNTYGNKSDAQLKIVSDEICNAITDQGIQLDTNDNFQLSKVLKQKIGSGYLLTGIVYESFSAPGSSINNGVITIPKFTVQFNNKVFYGTKQDDYTTVEVSQQTVSASSSWKDGVYFLYVDKNGLLKTQTEPVLASEGATKCFLGSFFVSNKKIQDKSWSYSPWIQQSSVALRTMPTAQTKGGIVLPNDATTIKIGALQISEEGINFGENQLDPNIKSFVPVAPAKYKFLYVGYDPAEAEKTNLDTTHIYNMTSGTWDDISNQTGFVVMVPCVTPTGQFLLIPPMSKKTGDTYESIFKTQDEAEKAIFGLTYQLDGVDKRAIYLGQSIIVKIGATDLTDAEQFEVYGIVPQELTGFSNQGGQTGGGVGEFIPMKEVINDTNNVNLVNNASNVLTYNSGEIAVSFPSPRSGILNQLEVKFTPSGTSSIRFPSETKWLYGSSGMTENGFSYTFVFEYNRSINAWVGGSLYIQE